MQSGQSGKYILTISCYINHRHIPPLEHFLDHPLLERAQIQGNQRQILPEVGFIVIIADISAQEFNLHSI